MPKNSLELRRVKNPKDAQTGILGWNAILEHEEASQPSLLLEPPIGDVFNSIAIRKHRRDRDHQNLLKIVQRPVTGFPRIVDFTQTPNQTYAIRRRHFVRPKDESRPDFVRAYKTEALVNGLTLPKCLLVRVR